MVEKIDAFILIDNKSKELIRNDVIDLVSHNILFINDLSELNPEQLKQSKTVIILEPYLLEYTALPKLRLFKQLLGIEYIFIVSNSEWFSELESLGRLFVYDTSVLTREIVQAAFFEDKSLEQRNRQPSSLISLYAIANNILKDTACSGDIKQLAGAILAVENSKSDLKNKIKMLEKHNANLEAKCLTLQVNNKKLREGYSKIFDDARYLNQTLQQYETYISSMSNHILNISDYKNSPNIIYLKEYESLLGIDLFLHTLYNVVRTQLQDSVKIVRIYDNKSSTKMLSIPDYYTVLTNDYLDSQVISNNFIAKSGDYKDILNLLLTNKSQLDTLIIYDCRNVNNTVISGSIMQLGICGDVNHIKLYGLNPNIAVVNNSPNTECLNFNFLEYESKLQDLKTDYERFMFLSSQDIYQKILGLIELQKSIL